MDVKNLVLRHLLALRQHPLYKYAQLRVFVENNLSRTVADIVRETVLQRSSGIGNAVVPSFDKRAGGGVGCPTFNEQKIAYTQLLHDVLSRGLLRFSAKRVGKEYDRHRETLFAQMASWSRIEKPPTNPLARGGVTFGGKDSGKKDDVLLALMISLYYGQLYSASQ